MSKNETCPVDANVGRDAYHSAPPLPPNSVYTNCYCEENIYLLAQVFSTRAEKDKNWPWLVYAVFISNDDQTVGSAYPISVYAFSTDPRYELLLLSRSHFGIRRRPAKM